MHGHMYNKTGVESLTIYTKHPDGMERCQFWMLLKRETGNGERESGNECTAVIPIRIQNRLFNAT